MYMAMLMLCVLNDLLPVAAESAVSGYNIVVVKRPVGGAAVRSAEKALRGDPDDSIVTEHGSDNRRRSSYAQANRPSHWSWRLRCLGQGSSSKSWMPKLQPLTCQTAQDINRRTTSLSSAIREHLCSIICRPEYMVGGLQPGDIRRPS
ncbi:uncharacterized protein LACBIDRAFT_323226 [Laccaria bicolor S238N-H82]|uniref:Predicted protein n=1 Tax=Laccaria bicolor (strain S238N-H82 / ATCC MYA-4686) TaxID=486041 RepID=B0CZI4_LACBS|nr:uncharacterized protein LACBIDRAFT_323226 [Laccaria bicolor S238N-H82]EDR12630.1 predicted protein [Laccaria bicolor S238N-H82]|eukprot:XP_001876894.1 predicted protein [Laccaria bicolor S238N-H82]